ncbi:hypothetical protein [Pseudomonas sp. MWU12-2323]|nr:hypothetical protein [Pseudomonas sp. MWU12-2323]
MTRTKYTEARDLAQSLGVELPEPDALERGGIVGQATISDA